MRDNLIKEKHHQTQIEWNIRWVLGPIIQNQDKRNIILKQNQIITNYIINFKVIK